MWQPWMARLYPGVLPWTIGGMRLGEVDALLDDAAKVKQQQQ